MKSNVCNLHAPTHNPSPLPPSSQIHDSKIWTRTHSQRLIVWPSECEVFLCVLQPPPPCRHKIHVPTPGCLQRLARYHILQLAATCCNALQRMAHCNTLQHTATQRTATYDSLQHTTTHCNAWYVAWKRSDSLDMCVSSFNIHMFSLYMCGVHRESLDDTWKRSHSLYESLSSLYI